MLVRKCVAGVVNGVGSSTSFLEEDAIKIIGLIL